MHRAIQSLLLKANRTLGAQLVKNDLVSLKHLDAANELFIERVRQQDPRRASLLRILLYEQQTLDERALLDFQLAGRKVGGLLLDSVRINASATSAHPAAAMQATWTLPFDCLGNVWFLATAYYLSDVARQYWQEQIQAEIVWYAVPFNQIEEAFERILPPPAAAPQPA
jgi:hypothetical protein